MIKDDESLTGNGKNLRKNRTCQYEDLIKLDQMSIDKNHYYRVKHRR